MNLSTKGADLIKKYEGFRDKAYLCPAGVPTIGYGSTMWNDGKKVELGQQITREGAERLLAWESHLKGMAILGFLRPTEITQNQFDALLSFTFNLGVGAFRGSTLARKVKRNPNDPTIRAEFLKWNKARVNGKLTVLSGLTRRRTEEANLYFTK